MNKLAIGVILFSIGLGLAFANADNLVFKQQSFTFEANATVVNATGDPTKNFGVVTEPNLDFGSMPEGAGSIKFFNMSAPRESLITIDSKGNISDHLDYSKDFLLNGTKEVQVKFNASRTGYYTGQVHVKTKVPKNQWGKRWLDLRKQLY